MRTQRHSPTRHVWMRAREVFVALFALAACSAPSRAQVLREEFWIPDTPASDVAVANGAVYLAGDFTQVGPATGGFVGLDRTTGAILQPLPEVLGSVNAMVDDGAGGWYIGGFFTAVKGQPRRHLAHLDAAGQLTGWNPDADHTVLSLVRDPVSGIVYAGGDFDSVGGQRRVSLAAIAPDGTVMGWDAGFGDLSAVSTLALTGGVLYAGGSFYWAGGEERLNAAAFDAASAALLPWNPGTIGGVSALSARVVIGFPSTVVVYLGGGFTTVGGQPRAGLAAVDGASGALLAWNPATNGSVASIATFGGTNPLTNPFRIYVAGAFSQIAGTPRANLAELNEAGGVAPWNPGADGAVTVLRIAGSQLYVGGQFSVIGGQPIRNLAAVDRTTGVASSWDGLVGGTVWAIGTTANAVFAGGQFWTVGGVRRDRLAALDLVSGLPTSWDPSADAAVRRLAVGNGVVYACGSFTHVGGQPRGYLAALDPSSGAATAWAPEANDFVHDLALGDGVVYAGGNFTAIGGQVRSRLAAIDAASGLATAWNPEPDGQVTLITESGGSVYVGGFFFNIGGQPRTLIAEIDAASGLASVWNPTAPPISGLPTVFDIQPHGEFVWMGGDFDEMGGRPRDFLATVDSVTGVAHFWDHYTDGIVTSLEIEGGALYVAGEFDRIAAVERSGIAVLDLTTGEILPWSPGIKCRPNALVVQDGVVYASGTFDHLHRSFAVFADPPTAAVAGAPAPVGDRLRASPNPFRSSVTLGFSLPRSGRLEVGIHDLAGRLVRRLARGPHEAGELNLAWDGRDDTGQSVRAGVYFVRVESESMRATAKVLRLE